MNTIHYFFLLFVAPLMALLIAILGFETRSNTPIGWFLFLMGTGLLAGVGIFYAQSKQHLWERKLKTDYLMKEKIDPSFWLINIGMIGSFFLSPLEYMYFFILIPRHSWITFIGLLLAIFGAVLVIWARLILGHNFSGYLSLKSGYILKQIGPYRFLRHPAYVGYFLVALGVSLGYTSLIGLISTLLFLLPSLIYRVKIEEEMLYEKFGELYTRYASKTKRFIPGIW